MDTNKPTIIEQIEEAVLNGDKAGTAVLLETMYDQLRTDAVLINWIITPANLTGVQNIIMENFDIPRKAMMVRNRVPDRRRRALMFTQAMKVAVTRSLNG